VAGPVRFLPRLLERTLTSPDDWPYPPADPLPDPQPHAASICRAWLFWALIMALLIAMTLTAIGLTEAGRATHPTTVTGNDNVC
jgi:hypothetical protein